MTEKNKTLLQKSIKIVLKGLLWLLPMVAVIMIILWIYDKIHSVVNAVFSFIGFDPQKYEFLWFIAVILIFLSLLYIIGHFVETRLASIFERLFCKIPGYSTIKDIFSIFSSSKDGKTKVLVVAIRGFANEGYNIGLMYSQNESIIKEHYTVTLSQTPIPNGGYLFEVHKDNIFVIEEATFDDNLQYLLSMGVKSMSDILKTKPKGLDELTPFKKWLES